LEFRCRAFFFSSRRRHTRFSRDWSSDVCSSDLRFPFRFRRSFGEDFAAVHVVERLAKLGARAGAEHVAPHLFQERELLGARIERSEERRVGKEWRAGGVSYSAENSREGRSRYVA